MTTIQSAKAPRASRRGPANRLPPERRIAEIIAAARMLLAERGYENCVISEIAERAGVVEGTIYRYFENKRDLFIKVAESWFEELLGQQEDIAHVTGTQERLRRTIRRALSIIRHEPALTRFVLMELRPDPDYKNLRLYRLNRAFVSGVMQVLKEANAKGEIDPALSLPLLRDMVFGAIEHQTWAFLRDEGDFSVDETTDGITAVVFRGMQPVPTAGAGAEDMAERMERMEAAIARIEAR
jgi:AcrR family transcriptional regulator